MHNWDNHYEQGHLFGHSFFMVLMLIVWVGVIWALVSVLRNNGRGGIRAEGAAKVSAQQILNERLARGEISEDEFKSRSEALKSVSQ